jgi:hypothetical protein
MDKFEKILKEKGISKVQFAEKLGINPANVNRLLKKFEKNLSEIDNSFQTVGINITPYKDEQNKEYIAVPANNEDKEAIPLIPIEAVAGFPAGATAICNDGTYSFSQSRRGTCSHHGGVNRWLR